MTKRTTKWEEKKSNRNDKHQQNIASANKIVAYIKQKKNSSLPISSIFSPSKKITEKGKGKIKNKKIKNLFIFKLYFFAILSFLLFKLFLPSSHQVPSRTFALHHHQQLITAAVHFIAANHCIPYQQRINLNTNYLVAVHQSNVTLITKTLKWSIVKQ